MMISTRQFQTAGLLFSPEVCCYVRCWLITSWCCRCVYQWFSTFWDSRTTY